MASAHEAPTRVRYDVRLRGTLPPDIWQRIAHAHAAAVAEHVLRTSGPWLNCAAAMEELPGPSEQEGMRDA